MKALSAAESLVQRAESLPLLVPQRFIALCSLPFALSFKEFHHG